MLSSIENSITWASILIMIMVMLVIVIVVVVVVVLMLVIMTVTLFMGMLFFFSMSSLFAFLFICLYQRLRGIIGVFFFLLSFEFEDMLEIFLLKLFKTFVLGKF